MEKRKDEIPVITVEIQSYMKVVRELLEEGRDVPMLITGSSMTPFLVDKRDHIMIRKRNRSLKKGDMAFYQRINGAYVMHRIVKVSGNAYYFVGDAQTEIEGPIYEDQIFGEIISVCRKGKWIGPEDFWWKFFQYVWIRMIPFRGCAVKAYGKLVRKKK